MRPRLQITSDDEHAAALDRIEELWHAKSGTPEADELIALVEEVEAYEDRFHPIHHWNIYSRFEIH